MTYNAQNPLIVQSDLTMLLEVKSPLYNEVRDHIAPFSEIIKSPEHMHTYRMTPISLWNASSAGFFTDDVINILIKYSRFEMSENISIQIKALMGRYGKVRLETWDEGFLKISMTDELLMERFFHIEAIERFFEKRINKTTVLIKKVNRGVIKQAFIKEGYPVMDKAGYRRGLRLEVSLEKNIVLRDYQEQARDAFLKSGTYLGGSGVIVLPCGAGKTVVGMAILEKIKEHVLILVIGTTAVKQWKRELLEKTTLMEKDIGEFTGEKKEIKPVTIATYQILTHRKHMTDEFTHFDHINQNSWGFVIYDEVHLLPAQMFRFTASLQGIRRLGLTATLIREDKKETDVFSLIGPKNYDMSWKDIEQKGWIAQAQCYEVHVTLDKSVEKDYVTAPKRQRFRIVSENPAKSQIVEKILDKHKDEHILIIGQYIKQLEMLAMKLNVPLIMGKTAQEDREVLYQHFREGKIKVLMVSSVANFSIDLPDASVAIQISGKFGSRQEEAQRLGRILRPKKGGNKAYFYTLVTAGTEEQDFALNRQLFLTEQGYDYIILDEKELCFENVAL